MQHHSIEYRQGTSFRTPKCLKEASYFYLPISSEYILGFGPRGLILELKKIKNRTLTGFDNKYEIGDAKKLIGTDKCSKEYGCFDSLKYPHHLQTHYPIISRSPQLADPTDLKILCSSGYVELRRHIGEPSRIGR